MSFACRTKPSTVNHNPFLRMAELPKLLQRLRSYRGRRQTQLGLRLLLLTGVRLPALRMLIAQHRFEQVHERDVEAVEPVGLL